MFIVLIGGGKVGYHMTKELLDIGHEVVLMEKDAVHARKLKAELGSLVIGHDGCEGRWLLEAGIKRADLVLAVTGEDEDNLIICQLASSLSKGKARTIARVNNPKNASVFRRLGVDETVSATDLILSMIEQDVEETGAVVHLMKLAESNLELVEFRLGKQSRAVSRSLGELELAKRGCNVCLLIRGRETLFPERDLELQSGDMIVALVHMEDEVEIRNFLTEPEVRVEMS
jgi:trk system potassium uptake protein TrkA